MKFFSMLYLQEGKGIEKDAPPKTGSALFLEILRRDGWDICKLSMLFLLCCIPIFTIPAALGALHTAVMRIVRDVPGDWFEDFKHGMRKNLKQAYLCALPAIFLPILLIIAFRFYFARGGITTPLYLLCGAGLLLCAMAWVYLFPLLTTISLSCRHILRNAILLPLCRPQHAAPVVLLVWVLFILSAWFPLPLLPIWLLFSVTVSVFIGDFIAWQDIKRLTIL